MNKKNKIFISIVAGAAAGALLGILFAPGKGRNTRKKFNDKMKNISGDLKENLEKYKEKCQDKKDAKEREEFV